MAGTKKARVSRPRVGAESIKMARGWRPEGGGDDELDVGAGDVEEDAEEDGEVRSMRARSVALCTPPLLRMCTRMP